jgi:shikimate 5-dehydrogenase
LVIGAGGMARAAIYALIKLGCRHIFIYNRTKWRAEEVAWHFNRYAKDQKLSTSPGSTGGQICHVLESETQHWPAGHLQPTMIVSCIPAPGIDGTPQVDFRMPSQWLRSPTGGVVVEVGHFTLFYPPLLLLLPLRFSST